MANIKFSAFTQKVAQADVDFLVGYTGADNVRIAPSTLGDGIYLPLAGGTMTGNVIFNDNVDLYLGTGNDFQAYHDGSNTYLRNLNGDFIIKQDKVDADLIFQNDDGTGGVETYFYLDGSASNTRFANPAKFSDNVMAKFGDGEDLKIYADGTDSYIKNTEGIFYIDQTVGDGDMKFRCDNGTGGLTSYFYLDGSAVNTRFAKDIKFTDGIKALFGGSGDLEIYHDGSHSYIKDSGTGSLKIFTSNFVVNNAADTENMIIATDGGSVKLYYAGSKKLETTSGGIEITDEVSIGTSIIHTGDTDTKISFGTDEIVLTTAGADRVTVKSDGKVGIGPSSPLANLDVSNTAGTTYQQWSYDNPGANNYNLTLSETVTAGNVRFCFNQRNAGITYSDVLVFNQGNVGIGTDAPDAPLHILKAAGGANIVTALKLDPDDTTLNSGVSIDFNASSTNTGATLVGSRIIGAREGANASGFLALYTSPDAGGSVPLERMRIDSAGNVGIGTDTPDAKLEISDSTDDNLRIGTRGGNINLFSVTDAGATAPLRLEASQFDFINGNATFAGDIEVENSTDGLILESPDGTRYRVTVANGGTLSVAAV